MTWSDEEREDRDARDAVERPGEHPLPTAVANQHGTSDVVAGPAGSDGQAVVAGAGAAAPALSRSMMASANCDVPAGPPRS